MMHKKIGHFSFFTLRIYVAGLILSWVMACSTSQVEAPSGDLKVVQQQSQVEVQYVLDRDQHRFVAHTEAGVIQAGMYRDRSLIREGQVDAKAYAAYLAKAETVMEFYKKQPLIAEFCRRPFQILMQKNGKSTRVQGCRRDQDALFGKFLREGEFLLYSSRHEK